MCVCIYLSIYIWGAGVLGSEWGTNAARPTLAFTRYCFTSRPLCTNQSSLYCPSPPALPTQLQYDCNTIAQYSTPLRPPVFMPDTIQYCV